ncbi:MAG: multicopper oxidase domain-containing protein [Bryocella sp.]
MQTQSMRMSMPAKDQARKTQPKTLDALALPSFVDQLPLPQLLAPQGQRSSKLHDAVDAPYYPVTVREVSHSFHRDLPPARQWSYGDGPMPVLIEAERDHGVLVDYINHLPPNHILPIDGPMHGMEYLMQAPPTRMITHLHGARVPHDSDGYPEEWFGPGKSKLCYYPNHQDSTALWMHDHAMGVSRLNVFAGLAGWYLLRDEEERALNLPSGPYEVPLMLYDRSFTPAGQLYYPNPPDEGAWAQEYLGDAMVVNGKVRPFHEVEPRKYRLRVANVANSRFFALAFSNGQSFHVIGSDQGLLSAPVEMTRLVLAPAERVDLIVDFSGSRGGHVNLISDSLDIMQFRVGKNAVTDTSVLPQALRSIQRIPESSSIRNREMTLNQFDGDNGEPMVMLLNRKHWVEPITDYVKLNTTEVWSFINLTQDIHPMHLHMVHFQVLDRQSFSTYDYLSNNKLVTTGPAMPPAAHELGWKDVVQCPPDTVTRIIVPFQGYAGKYLWHCHILEHEANDMMRPYVITA